MNEEWGMLVCTVLNDSMQCINGKSMHWVVVAEHMWDVW